MKQIVSNSHYRPLAWPFGLLKPLAWAYGVGVACRLAAYKLGWLKTTTVSVPVISVGNLTTGGTGKTPVVLALGQTLLEMGYRVVILSRGYGAKEPIAYGQATHPAVGDEAYMLQQALPDAVVIVGRDRAKNAQRAVTEYHPDVILLDDGFQYIKLHRTHNIVLVDGEKQFGNRQLLPLGPLREPLSQLKRATALWVTKVFAEIDLPELSTGDLPVSYIPFDTTQLVSVATQVQLPLTALQGQEIIAISGIAHPDHFESSLTQQGAKLLRHYRFNDHHVYQASDLAPLMAEPHAPGAWWVTTEKDWVKLQGLLPDSRLPSVYTLKVQPVFDFRATLHGFGFPDRQLSQSTASGEAYSGDAVSLHRGHAADGSLSPQP